MDRRTPCDPDGNSRFEPLQVTKEVIQKSLRSFPAGSSQHITDLLTGATDDLLRHALVDFVNMQLFGACDNDINAVIFGGRVIALSKKTAEFARFQWATH